MGDRMDRRHFAAGNIQPAGPPYASTSAQSPSSIESDIEPLTMGKKQEKKPGGAVSIPHMPQKELYQRVNFAVQASTYLQSLGIDPQAGSSDRKGKRKAYRLDPEGEYDDNAEHSVRSAGARLDYTALAKGGMKITKRMIAHTQLKL